MVNKVAKEWKKYIHHFIYYLEFPQIVIIGLGLWCLTPLEFPQIVIIGLELWCLTQLLTIFQCFVFLL
jgi:hypothetical protein